MPEGPAALLAAARSDHLHVADADARLAEQIDFYEADAVPVNEWIVALRDPANHDPYAVGARARFERLRDMFDRIEPGGRVLEIAAGTGAISILLAPHAHELVLLDTSATSLKIAREHLGAAGHEHVTTVHADVFSWAPDSEDATFDTVCFSAWLHHVPLSHFELFWERINRLLRPRGVVLCDVATSFDANPEQRPPEPTAEYSQYHDPAHEQSFRDLGGRRWRVVHRVWDLANLRSSLRRLGWSTRVELREDDGFDWISARRL